MAKAKIVCEMASYGIYSGWDRESRELPTIVKHSHQIPARIGIEFGYILHIKGAKGKKIHFTIDHPPFPDSSGEIAPPFTGEVYVKSNNWHFFLGDTIWEPEWDKVGPWRLITRMENKLLADETFDLIENPDSNRTEES